MYFWIFIIILLSIIEASTVNLTTIWFIVSALITLLLSFICDNIIIQFASFVILGIVLLITTKPLVKKIFNNNTKTNLDRVIDMKGIVTLDIEPLKVGEVKVDGKIWSAISSEKLCVGDIVKILEIDGVKLKVKKWED